MTTLKITEKLVSDDLVNENIFQATLFFSFKVFSSFSAVTQKNFWITL